MIDSKTIMCWNVPAIEGGSPTKFAQVLIEHGFEGVCVKAADGPYVYKVSRFSPWPLWGENVKDELVDALKAAGLKVYFWAFLYGNNPVGEMNIAISQSLRFEPDGYIFNVETKFDGQPNAVGNARLISKGLRQAIPNLPQGLCWWALPKSPTTGAQWHPIPVAEAFLETVNTGMPMMYWQGSSPDNAVSYFNDSYRIWRSFCDKPIVPIGRCYDGTGGYANGPAIVAFADEVWEHKYDVPGGVPGISWYSFDKAYKKPEWMAALKATPKYHMAPPPIDLTDKEKLDRLVAAHPELFPEL